MISVPTAILIDLDGTLCNTDASVQAGIDGACEEAQRTLGVQGAEWREANAAAAREVWSTSAQRWIDGDISALDLSTQIYAKTLAAVGADAALAGRFVNVHGMAAAAVLRLYADVPAFLNAVRKANIKLALVTNGASDTQKGNAQDAALGRRIRCDCGFERTWRI